MMGGKILTLNSSTSAPEVFAWCCKFVLASISDCTAGRQEERRMLNMSCIWAGQDLGHSLDPDGDLAVR